MVMEIDFKEQGLELLKTHEELYNKLIKIPSSRELTYRVEIENNLRIGKPRFANRHYNWSKELYVRFRDHLEDIWEFFDNYSHWVTNSLMALLSYNKRRESKKSVIFLLEHDVWETDEIFGDYLIEKKEEHTIISHFRFYKKFHSFNLDNIQDNYIETWILNDVIEQIEKQFNYLWSAIEREIKTCIEEKYHKEPKLYITSIYLVDQFEKVRNIIETWPEAALLNLGRLLEMWLLINLEKDSSGFDVDNLRLVERLNLINKDEFKLLKKLRTNYNDLKHKRYYNVNKEEVYNLMKGFSNIFRDLN